MQLFCSWLGPELGEQRMTNPIDVNDGRLKGFSCTRAGGLAPWRGRGGIAAISFTELCATNQENLPEVENLRRNHKTSGRS